MNIKLTFISIFAVILLSSCETLKEMKADYNLKLLDRAKESCVKYGFKESTDSFAHCVQKEINEFKNRAAIESAAKEVNDK
tara:strand:- start:83 stop:325 length:243 start_codon:yes stop_codon:yes gene_type:complete